MNIKSISISLLILANLVVPLHLNCLGEISCTQKREPLINIFPPYNISKSLFLIALLKV